NTVGQLVYENNQVNAANNRLTVNTSNFEKGVYFVNMLQDNRTITKKLVVQ
ncbi:MAG: T9SS type A sorting domain-containing protein, partial [Bacteroidota bacterium]